MIPAQYTFKEPLTIISEWKPFCTYNGQVTSYTSPSEVSRFVKLDCGATIRGDKVRPNPYFVRKTDFLVPRGSSRLTCGDGFYIRTETSSEGPIQALGQGLNMPFSLPVFGAMPEPSDQLEFQATTKFYERLADPQAWNVEALEAAAMRHRVRIDKSYQRLDELSRDLVKRKSRNIRGGTKWIAEAWLKKQYLWQPVLNNIFDSSLAVQQAQLRPLKLKATVKTTERESVQFPFNTLLTPWIPASQTPLHVERERTMGIKYMVALKSNPLSVQDFLTLDPALVAWQLMPYSFCVDWIYNVSGYMASLETSSRFYRKFDYGSKTVFWHEQIVCSVSKQGTHQCGDSYFVSGEGGGTTKGFSRGVMQELPPVRPPVIDVSLSSERLLSLAALLGRRLKVPRWADYRRDFPA